MSRQPEELEIETRLRQLGVIQRKPFRTSTHGWEANQRVEMEVMYQDPELASQIVGSLALKIAKVYKPDVIIPVPDGANRLGQDVAAKLGIDCVLLQWEDKEQKVLRLKEESRQTLLEGTETVGLIDDVYTSGGNLLAVASFQPIRGKVKVAGVVWDRSDSGLPKKINPLVSVVEKYVALWKEDESSH